MDLKQEDLQKIESLLKTKPPITRGERTLFYSLSSYLSGGSPDFVFKNEKETDTHLWSKVPWNYEYVMIYENDQEIVFRTKDFYYSFIHDNTKWKLTNFTNRKRKNEVSVMEIQDKKLAS